MAIIKIRDILVDMILYVATDVYGPYITKKSTGINKLITLCINSICGTMVENLL